MMLGFQRRFEPMVKDVIIHWNARSTLRLRPSWTRRCRDSIVRQPAGMHSEGGSLADVALHSLRIIHLCAGVDGLGLGLKIALRRSRTVAYCEREPYAAAALVARMEGSALDQAPVWDSLESLARAMAAQDFSSWPTSRAEDSESCGNHPGATDSLTGAIRNWPTPSAIQVNDQESIESWNARRDRELLKGDNGNGMGMPLNVAVRQWPTPCATQAKQGQNEPDGKRGQSLVGAARGQKWPTPNYRSGSVSEKTRNKNSRPLQEQACLFTRPDPKIKDGLTFSESGPTSLPQLNPAFDCWLMGLPFWWTNIAPISCAAQEMESYL